MAFSAQVKGIQQAQKVNVQAIRALEPRGSIGQALKEAAVFAHRYLVQVTHVDTGAYQAAHRIELDLRALQAVISPDPSATNPRSGLLVVEYYGYEEARGGDHAAYERTEKEAGDRTAGIMVERVVRDLP